MCSCPHIRKPPAILKRCGEIANRLPVRPPLINACAAPTLDSHRICLTKIQRPTLSPPVFYDSSLQSNLHHPSTRSNSLHSIAPSFPPDSACQEILAVCLCHLMANIHSWALVHFPCGFPVFCLSCAPEGGRRP